MSNKSLFVVLAACVVLLDSCAYKRITYLQDMEPLTTYEFNDAPDTKIRKGDKVKIYVTCSTPELAAPFNITGPKNVVDLSTGKIDVTPTSVLGTEYLVEKDGTFDFPVLGHIYAEGKTLDQLRDDIAGQIKAKGYVKDPVVSIEFSNFNVTVLGEMSPGIYSVAGSISMLELIARCGDLNDYAMHEDLWVIRQEGNRKKVYSLDMTSKSCFDSPAFYLQQNDIVYAKPRRNKLDSSVTQIVQYSSILMTALSTVTMILVWTGLNKN